MYCKIMIAKTAILPFLHLHVDPMICKNHAKMLRCCYIGRVLIVLRVEFPCDDAIHSKWTRAVIPKWHFVRLKGAIGAFLKHFESDCFITKEVYTFDTTYEYWETSLSFVLGTSAKRTWSIICHIPLVLFTVNVANQLYHPWDHTKTTENV